jgi:siroheme synthase-like protein
MANTYLPISISLKDRPCLVVGGGKVALRKIDTLLDYESDVTVVAPEPVEKTEYYAGKNKIKLHKRSYRSPEARDFGLVISASDDHGVNTTVYEDCRVAGVPVNVVDNPALCDVIFPAVVKRDCLTVAVSTDGKAPFLAGHLRLILEGVFPERWSKLAKTAAQFRAMVQSTWQGQPYKKADAYERFVTTDWQAVLKEKKGEALRQYLEELVKGE